jgi:hypothetical protein
MRGSCIARIIVPVAGSLFRGHGDRMKKTVSSADLIKKPTAYFNSFGISTRCVLTDSDPSYVLRFAHYSFPTRHRQNGLHPQTPSLIL